MVNLKNILFKWLTLFFCVTFLLTWAIIINTFYSRNGIGHKYSFYETTSLLIFVFISIFLISNIFLNKILKSFKISLEKSRKNSSDQNVSKNSEFKFLELLDSLPQSIFETDENGKLVYANKNLLKTFGYNKIDIRDKRLSISDILIFDTIEKIYNETELFEADMLGVRKNSSVIPVSVYSSNISSKNKIIGLRGIIIEDTNRVKYIETLQGNIQQLTEENELKTKLLTCLSSELRPPVNAILGFSNLLTFPGKSEENKEEYTCQIITQGERLLKLIDNIIDLANIEAGDINNDKYEFDLNMLLTDIYSFFLQLRNKKNKSNVELKLQHDFKNEPFFIHTDPLRLRQILNDLISNALQNTQSGYIEFGFSNLGSIIHFYVKDTGSGISENIQKIIFERTNILELPTGKINENVGLGLTITRSLVELLGGRIWLSSEIGVGTTFYFTIRNEKQKDFGYQINKEILNIASAVN